MEENTTRFRRSTNKTHPDHRNECSLQSRHKLYLKSISQHIKDENELQKVILSLMSFIKLLQSKQFKKSFDINLSDSDDDASSASSTSSMSLDFLDLDTAMLYSDYEYSDLYRQVFEDDDSSDSSCSSDSDSDSDLDSDALGYPFSPSFTKINFNDITTDNLIPQEYLADGINYDKYTIVMILFSTILGCSLQDIDCYIRNFYEVSTISSEDWNNVLSSTNTEEKHRTIASMPTSECYMTFRFNSEELQKMKEKFFDALPVNSFKTKKNRFTFEETMLIALHYNVNGNTYYSMREVFGGDWSRYSIMVNWFATFIHHKFYHRLSGNSLEYWAQQENFIASCRAAIFNFVCLDEEGNLKRGLDPESVRLDLFRVFGWIDCMQHICARPGGGPVNENNDRRENEYNIQRAFYTAYGHKWGMKTQAILLPNGMYASIFTASIAQNDKGLVNISGVGEELERVLDNHRLVGGDFPAVYGDAIYDVHSTIVKNLEGHQDVFHKNMNKSRIDVEHIFGLNSTLWKRLNVNHSWHILAKKKTLDRHFFTIFFLTNVWTIFRENKTGLKYMMSAPDIEEYLQVSRAESYEGHEDESNTMLDLLSTQNNW